MASLSEEQWRRQVAAMQEAVAALKLPVPSDAESADDADDDSDYDSSASGSSSRGQDIWDFISDSELEALGLASGDDDDDDDDHNNSGADHGIDSSSYGPGWLAVQCQALAARRGTTAMPADVLQAAILDVLQTARPDEELSAQLTDLVGLDDLDLVIELLAHRAAIVAAAAAAENMADAAPRVDGARLLTRAQQAEQLRQSDFAHKTATLAAASAREERYPHVYRAYDAGNTLSVTGQRYGLPQGSTVHEREKYTEYAIPAGQRRGLGPGERLVRIADLDGLCRGTFEGYTTLNRMQSLVYPVAYGTSENMLICAPTGAGKTDAALLTILHTVGHYTVPRPAEAPAASDLVVDTQDWKIVYVAPMKALAAEITEKMGRRLAWLGVRVREYTGDMHLTKAEIVQTQILVTTPEKWDVVTRRGVGDTELVQKVRLLVLDEVHMLHDERGAVLESLVARTQRQVESTQSLIRIVGLSATLPTYVDVADFLRVNRRVGLFYFDASFRPVPLQQHFVGVKGKVVQGRPGRDARENLDAVAFDKTRALLAQGHQVMVFVHTRRDTAATAAMLHERPVAALCLDLHDPRGHPRYEAALAAMRSSRARELRDLLPKGLGVHHAGMARADRRLTERLFGEGVLRVLCCTATLAWGVNLPAAAVLIKGTQVYSAADGRFVDLGILDVLQIFGRAGRPQFEDTGIGILCTTHDKLAHYLTAVTEQLPIESRFAAQLVDNLNAEVALGTVTSIAEAVQWIGYAYLFVRMRRNPMAYGVDWAAFGQDPQLVQRRRELAVQAARTLRQSQMVVYHEATDELRSKDVGRIASQFYIRHATIQLFNSTMRPQATEADVLQMLARSSEFDNVTWRESEERELARLREVATACEVGGAPDSAPAKTNVLLQAYISRVTPDDFALANDQAFVAQQAARICRALFLLALHRWGHQCLVVLALAKAIERRLWPFAHPLGQFEQLPRPVLARLDAATGTLASVAALRDMTPGEMGSLVHNHGAGAKMARLLRHFPTLTVEAAIAPLSRDVLRVRLALRPDFAWHEPTHGAAESYHVWVEHADSGQIYHHAFFVLSRRKLHDDHVLSFTIPLADPLPDQIYVRAVSDRWLGAETVTPVSFQHLIRPDTESVYTDLLDLPPLPISALQNPVLEALYAPRFAYFNPMQTQIFHTLYHTPANVLLGSPTGSGKTVAAELALWWALRERPGSKVVYVAPMKALVRERLQDWGARLAGPAGLRLVELTGDNTPDTRSLHDADVLVTTPEKWDGISRSWQTRRYVRQVSLVILDEIHLLAGDRGPILEMIVSRMNAIAAATQAAPVRLLGMSTACANAADLAHWLGVPRGQGALFNFRHSVRPVPLELYIDGFPDMRGFCPLMQAMNRPTFLAIKNHSPDKPVIVFVPSRRQTRLTAKDLVNLCGLEDNPRRFLRMGEDDLQANLARVQDEALREALSFGIGLHHAGLVEGDRQLAEELFLHGQIQILVATSTLAWGVNLPAHLVVVKGTQFFDAKTEGYKDMDLTDVLQMLGRAGRPQFDQSGVARIFTQDAKKDFYKHFLHTGFPVESSLHTVLDNHLCAEVAAATMASKQDALDYLTWTFFFRRLHKNPSYYGLALDADGPEAQDGGSGGGGAGGSLAAQHRVNAFLADMVDKAFAELAASRCVEVYPNGDVAPTPLGKIMSYYYLSHKTIRHLARHARPRAAFADVLAWMCHATEYDELPVRHNEDLVNAELAANLPLPATAAFAALPLWDPHVKAFLLLQAHMARIALPLADYVGDQTSVLDQAVRILQAAIDVLAELNHLSSCLQMMALLQCVKSAAWPADPPAALLPGVTRQAASAAVGDAGAAAGTLQAISALADAAKERLAASLQVPAARIPAFRRAVALLPNVHVAVRPVTASSVTVHLHRRNALADRDGRMYAPKFHKPQTEGFFVVVGDLARDEVYGIKRMGWGAGPPSQARSGRGGRGGDGRRGRGRGGDRGRGGAQTDRSAANGSASGLRTTAKAVVQLPEAAARNGKVDVLVVSDGYVGLEYRVLGVEVPPPPVVDGVDKKGQEETGERA